MAIIKSKHSRDDIDLERRHMLGDLPSDLPVMSLGHLMRLVAINSPIIFGGTISPSDVVATAGIYDNAACADSAQLFQSTVSQISSAWRALEIVLPATKPIKNQSHIDQFSPEWLADIMSAVAACMPSATPDMILWEMPLTLSFHLVAANYRRNGGATRRPDDRTSIMDALQGITHQTT